MPEPVLIAIASALAGKAATGLYDLVKEKFSGNREATKELEAAAEAPAEPLVVDALARRLENAEEADPEFKAALRSGWTSYSAGNVTNQVSGTVSGKLVQARDIQGNISL